MTQEPNDPAPEETPEATGSTEASSPLLPPTPDPHQVAARDRLKQAVSEFEGALEEVVAVGLDALAELADAGFSLGGELPPVDVPVAVPPGQLPPV